MTSCSSQMAVASAPASSSTASCFGAPTAQRVRSATSPSAPTAGGTCRCGRDGCLETWVSAPRLEATLAGLHGAAAIDALSVAGERLGIALAPIVAALDLQEVVLNGPEHLVSGALIDATERTLRDRVMTRSTRDLVVRLALDGSSMVLRGAAARIVTEIFDLIAST